MPGIKATGTNTAASVNEVAITATPISSAASLAACIGGLPIRRWRTMFSTSTMASSTRMPTTTDNASRVIRFRLKLNKYITAKVGIIDSGKATDEIHVARQSRRKNQTTNTASNAPSTSMIIEESYERCASSTVEVTSWKWISGFAASRTFNASTTFFATAISLEPTVRDNEKATTGLPSSMAICEASAALSLIFARSDKSHRATVLQGNRKIFQCIDVFNRTYRSHGLHAAFEFDFAAGRSVCVRANCCETCPAVMP